MKELQTAIEIDASTAQVWQQLTDFASFKSRNPLIREAKGEATGGLLVPIFATGLADIYQGLEAMSQALKIQIEKQPNATQSPVNPK